MEEIERLVAIEAIRAVKARYWYFLDTKDWEGMRSVFSEDAVVDLRAEQAFSLGAPADDLPPVETAIAAGDPAVVVGNENIADFIRTVTHQWTTVHHGAEPIIEIDAPDSGSARWPFFDYIDDGTRALKGYGHYHERYRPNGEAWAITSMTLTRIRADGDYPTADNIPT